MNSFVKVGSSNYWPSNEKSKCYAKYYIFRTIIYIWDRACTCTWLSKKSRQYNKFTRRRKYYQSSSQFIQCLIYLYLWKNIYLTECVPKSIQLDNNFVSFHFISFPSRAFSILYLWGLKNRLSCTKRGGNLTIIVVTREGLQRTIGVCLAKNSDCILL